MEPINTRPQKQPIPQWAVWLIGLLFPAIIGAAAGLLNNLKQYEARISILEYFQRTASSTLERMDRKIDHLLERANGGK